MSFTSQYFQNGARALAIVGHTFSHLKKPQCAVDANIFKSSKKKKTTNKIKCMLWLSSSAWSGLNNCRHLNHSGTDPHKNLNGLVTMKALYIICREQH